MWRDYCQRNTPNEQSSTIGSLLWRREIKLAGLSFDAIILAAITSTDNKGQLELSTCASQFAYTGLLYLCLSATFMLNISETKRFNGSCPLANANGASIDDVINDVT